MILFFITLIGKTICIFILMKQKIPIFFIVAGLLVKSRDEVIFAYNRFKKNLNNIHIGPKEKSILFTEFKATLLDRKYKKFKIKMLEEIANINPIVYFSCYYKENSSFNQKSKEEIYIKLLTNILLEINNKVDVVFDLFAELISDSFTFF